MFVQRTSHGGWINSWTFHGEQGWFIGTAISHYRCIPCYIPKTHCERITDTATIIPKHTPIPQASYKDHICWTSEDLFQLLKHKQKLLLPKALALVDEAILEISKILHQASMSSLNTKNNDTQNISSTNVNILLEVTIHRTLQTPSLLSSEGVPTLTPSSVSTSEGGGGISSFPNKDNRIKQITETSIPTNMELHPGLCPAKIIIQRTQQAPSLFKRITLDRISSNRKLIPTLNQPINKLIEQYKAIPKELSSYIPKRIQQQYDTLSAPTVPLFYIPIPKHYKLPRTTISHPMLLRRRNLRSQYTPHRLNRGHLHAQNINKKIMHIFDV